MFFFYFWMLFEKREKREYSSDIVIAQRLPVLVLFMFIRSSIMGEGNHSSSKDHHSYLTL